MQRDLGDRLGPRDGEWPATLDLDQLAATGWRPKPFRQFLLKIHSRCNLACDYCYVYTLADQSWRQQPLLMSLDVVAQAARRIDEHARTHGLTEVQIILHGGEPLLAGRRHLAETVGALRSRIDPAVAVRIGLQSNGVLLDEDFLTVLGRSDVSIGVSVDGTAAAHDRHRTHANGRGSHAEVAAALSRLASPEHRRLYGGLLCTINLHNDPVECYEALLRHDPPAMDFLLPQGNWSAPPPGREPDSATPYADWLIKIFDRWYGAARRETRIRLFEELIHLLLGGMSATEAVGLTPSSLVVVETDGSIEQSDDLTAAYPHAAWTGLHVGADSFDAAAGLPGFAARQLGIHALSDECRACTVVQVCGGGLYAHRYRSGQGFRNPSVYCTDLYRLIIYIRDRILGDLRRYLPTG